MINGNVGCEFPRLEDNVTVSEKSVAVFVDCLVSEVRIHLDVADACVIMVFQARGFSKVQDGGWSWR